MIINEKAEKNCAHCYAALRKVLKRKPIRAHAGQKVSLHKTETADSLL